MMDISGVSGTGFPVRFSNMVGRWGAPSAPLNGLSLAGDGRVSLEGGVLRVSGTVQRSFQAARPLSVECPLGAVWNVVRIKNRLHLELELDGGRRPSIDFWLRTEDEARTLESQLPTGRTEAFQKELEANREYRDRLGRVGGKPRGTVALLAANVVVFVAMAVLGGGLLTAVPEVLTGYGTNYGPLTLDGQWWRLFSSMFIHFGILHLAFNMYALWQLGAAAERFFGSAAYLLLYVGSGLAGALASLWWNPVVNSAGASGAIFGIVGGLLVFVLRKDSGIPLAILKQYRKSTLLFAGYSLLYGFAHSGIDNAAHVGGLLAGALIGLAIARPLKERETAEVEGRRLVLGGGTALLLLLALWGGATHPSEGDLRALELERRCQKVIRADEALVALFGEIAAQVKAGKEDDHALARRVRSDYLPTWAGLEKELGPPPPDPQGDLEKAQAAWARYVEATRRGLQAVVDAEQDPAKIEGLNRAFADRKKIAEEIRRLHRR